MKQLRACDYGAPTIRKRLFVVARCDGLRIVWPEPTHGPGRIPFRAAAECIDWTIPVPSIFGRRKPLAENTLRRIARGIQRFVVDAAEPFIVPVKTWGGGGNEPRSLHEPMRTTTTSKGGEFALVTPFLTEHANASGQRIFAADEPLRTQCANVKGGHFALVAPTLISTRNGERVGQAPRVRDILEPAATVTAQGSQGALVAAFLAKHFGGHETPGSSLAHPMATVTATDHHSLVTAQLGLRMPTGADNREAVRAFLVKFYGNEKEGANLQLPLGTVTTRDRFGLVTVHGTPYVIVDIGMRMLAPRELFRAQGFPEGYVIDPLVNGKRLTKTKQVACCGNSVAPDVAAALVAANVAVHVEEVGHVA
jgi:DNA (cytosine-5)-methyltransferase 1